MPLPNGLGTDMADITACKVIPGYGVQNTVGFLTSTNLTGLTPQQMYVLDVGECPIGSFSTGGDVASLCEACASTAGGGSGGLGPYSTTLETGSTNVTECNGKLPLAIPPRHFKFIKCKRKKEEII